MKKRILLVDDELGILKALTRLFRLENYELYTAAGGEKALELLGNQRVDLIISDMRMPGMDGSEFLSKARERYPNTVRILLTGYSDIDATAKAINDGGIFGYLAKPWDTEQLKELTRNALQYGHKINHRDLVLQEMKHDNDELKSCLERQSREMSMTDQYVRDADIKLQDGYITMEDMLLNMLELNHPGQRQVSEMADCTVQHLARQLCLDQTRIERLKSAARLHALGKVALDRSLLKTPLQTMSESELEQYGQYPSHCASILMSFPAYYDVSQIIMMLNVYNTGKDFGVEMESIDAAKDVQLLSLTVDYVEWRVGIVTGQAMGHDQAIQSLQSHCGYHEHSLIAALSKITMGVSDTQDRCEILLPVRSLIPGMVLKKDLYSKQGSLLLRSGTRLDANLVDQFCRLQANIEEKIVLSVLFEHSQHIENGHSHSIKMQAGQ